jgi:ribosome-binding factor A
MKHRIERVREVLKREIGDYISREMQFAAKLVTVQAVDITPDLRNCHVFVSAYGSDEAVAEVVPTLLRNRIAIQNHVAKRVVIKYTPHLHFKLDASIERGDRILQMIEELKPDDEP